MIFVCIVSVRFRNGTLGRQLAVSDQRYMTSERDWYFIMEMWSFFFSVFDLRFDQPTGWGQPYISFTDGMPVQSVTFELTILQIQLAKPRKNKQNEN